MLLTIIKYICLAVGIVYGFSNVIKGVVMICGRQATVGEFQNWAMGISIAGYIALSNFGF